MPAPDANSCDQLARLIGTPKAPRRIDLRPEALRAKDPRISPAARPLTEAEVAVERLSALAQLAAGMTLYDAFYRGARDATGETHDWPGRGPSA